jgi:hypothetical protein
MSMHRGSKIGSGAARPVMAFAAASALAGLSACSGESGNALSPGAINARVATVAIEPVTSPILAGDTVQLVAVARDDAGRVVERASVNWSVQDQSRATVLPGGRLVGVGHGTVSVTASAGRATASAGVPLHLTKEERRFAYAWIHDPSTSTQYHPTSSYQHNETGGGIRVSRQAVGRYVVSFERMAKVDSAFRETVIVTPHGSEGERCHLGGWGNNPNGRDLDVTVSCFTFAGASVDARFAVLVVGSRSLPSRLGFTVAGSAESAYAADPAHTFASFAEGVSIARSTAGSYLVQWNATADNTPQNYLVSTYGGAPDLCKVSSWNRGVWASIICYNPSGALADARFSLLMVESGRPGKRFGFAWANDPVSPLGAPYTPSLEYQRTSSGGIVTITRQATGQYIVSFPGLAKAGTRPETVHVSPYGGGLYACQVQGWSNSADATALEATVRCWNRGNGHPADTYFTALVLE